MPIAELSDSAGGVVICDRHSGYKKLARILGKILLAFCWAQGPARRVLNRNKAGLPEVRLSDREYPICEINVRAVKCERIAGRKTGRSEKSEERRIGQCAQSRGTQRLERHFRVDRGTLLRAMPQHLSDLRHVPCSNASVVM
ncbi:hypothetical protein [Accumulibacter sp.]|uniref:hypothetical protein n=1 Tax=Accumulibacter sp. TaxID=2053492 RepID=UPI00339024FA